MNRIDNFNNQAFGLNAVSPTPPNKKTPLFYLTALSEVDANNSPLIGLYFVNNSDETLKYLSSDDPINSDIVYLDVLPKQAVKIDQFIMQYMGDFLTQCDIYVGLPMALTYYFRVVFKDLDAGETIPLLNEDLTKPRSVNIAQKITTGKDQPISPIVLKDRQQWWLKLLTQYGEALANFMVACNDALYRYDLFPKMPYAYGLDLYDEYANESIEIAKELSSQNEVNTSKVTEVLLNVFAKYLGKDEVINLSSDCIEEILTAWKTFHNFNLSKDNS